MKKIMFEGVEYEVEDWVNYVAIDWYGDIHGYELAPSINGHNMTWSEVKGRVEYLGEKDNDWQSSLVKV